jgi:hypothetical protein
MTKITLSLITALLIASITPAFAAASDCNTGYKDFVSKMSTYVDKMSGDAIAGYIRKGLGAYDSCMAGDNSISPRGVWDGILAEMAAKK